MVSVLRVACFRRFSQGQGLLSYTYTSLRTPTMEAEHTIKVVHTRCRGSYQSGYGCHRATRRMQRPKVFAVTSTFFGAATVCMLQAEANDQANVLSSGGVIWQACHATCTCPVEDGWHVYFGQRPRKTKRVIMKCAWHLYSIRGSFPCKREPAIELEGSKYLLGTPKVLNPT